MELAMAISSSCVLFVLVLALVFGLIRRGKTSASLDLDYRDLVELGKLISTDPSVAKHDLDSNERARLELILRALESERHFVRR